MACTEVHDQCRILSLTEYGNNCACQPMLIQSQMSMKIPSPIPTHTYINTQVKPSAEMSHRMANLDAA